jgi:glyoxylase-like metal-dependent hydrolase (beta-lactamase superfamily II)
VLLVSDLVFNIQEPRGIGAWLILGLFGTYRRFGASRLFLSAVKDRAAFLESLQRIAALDFAHVAPGHGSVVSEEGKQKLLAALRERGYAT